MSAVPGLLVGTAGWSLPRDTWTHFPAVGSHLQRYAAVLPMAEINSSFYRPHAIATYARWAGSVPPGFRFSVKLPKALTHGARLVDTEAALDGFLAQIAGLGDRLGALLVQLPPSLAWDAAVAEHFLGALRARHAGAVALEPRHASWFTAAADAQLRHHRVARVLADPVLHAPGAAPGGWPGLVYLRLHGSPHIYRSAYDDALVRALADRIARAQAEGSAVWCVFDNTASGAATHNALALLRALALSPAAPLPYD